MSRVLVTGASGFIGAHCLPLLEAAGHDVHAASRRVAPMSAGSHIQWHQVDLLDAHSTEALLNAIQPTHLLHLAWYAIPRRFWTSPENLDWLQAGLGLIKFFALNGGQRIVVAGSCAEYDWTDGCCSELTTPLRPETLYGACKLGLKFALEAYCRQMGVSAAWGRIFHAYGPNESPERFVASVIRSIIKGEVARCSHGSQIRDFLHVEDVASAFVSLLASDITGAVNIASGQPRSLREIAGLIASKLARPDLLALGVLPAPENDPPTLVADVRRLSGEMGWQPAASFESRLEQTIEWWKNDLLAERKDT